MFWGHSEIAWIAIGSVATCIAVVVATLGAAFAGAAWWSGRKAARAAQCQAEAAQAQLNLLREQHSASVLVYVEYIARQSRTADLVSIVMENVGKSVAYKVSVLWPEGLPGWDDVRGPLPFSSPVAALRPGQRLPVRWNGVNVLKPLLLSGYVTDEIARVEPNGVRVVEAISQWHDDHKGEVSRRISCPVDLTGLLVPYPPDTRAFQEQMVAVAFSVQTELNCISTRLGTAANGSRTRAGNNKTPRS